MYRARREAVVVGDADLLQATYDQALARVLRDLGDVAGDGRITVDFTDPHVP